MRRRLNGETVPTSPRSKCRTGFALRTFPMASFVTCSRRAAPRCFSALPKDLASHQLKVCFAVSRLLLCGAFQVWRQSASAVFVS